jgi:two-component system, OmpR family, osmolarity sensor histidine kinase EnvZ
MSLRHLHVRLLLLLTTVVITALAAASIAFGLSTRDSNVDRFARALHAQVIAADALLSLPDRDAALAGLRDLDIVLTPEPLSGERPSLPLLMRTEAQLAARMPDRPLRLSGVPAKLWVHALPPARGWLGIPVQGETEPFRRGLLLTLAAIGIVVVLAAGLFARTLTRPLLRLTAAAPGIVAGEPPSAPLRFASEEILELQRALTDAAERTRAAARDRELMLAGISHDMRTPLARLRYALALDDHDIDADSRRGMERDIDEIDGIVGQFIDYIRDGRDESPQTVDLISMLQALARDEARQGRQWRLSLPGDATLSGRPLALRRALVNLFDNAGRHGEPPFEAELDAQSDGWRLRVFDRGPGVPEAALADLGRPFHRVDQARGMSGSGLGLASVARIAAVHGGGLRLRNRDGGGLAVELYLGTAPP